jgi:hypothetical protein
MKNLKLYISVSLSIILLSILTNCASYAVHDLSGYPETSRGVFVYNFTNDTFQHDVNREMTDMLTVETSRRGNFILNRDADQAAMWISGEITMYRKEGRMYDNFRDPVRYELIVACAVRLRTNPKWTGSNELLMEREFTSSLDFSDVEGFIEPEETARGRLLGRLSREIAGAIETAYVARFASSPAGK